ncbi:MAG: hypothetical protein EZS26_003542 [Candidatus Ordinivivax streblomastigis]|uniref:Uncharacterized protein n=1 Tax=Candidatus Ordinivivax streblomastigis TaxID=2540710 RepID=A0A5M8NTT1_9BACT|nr:MAG: hypothetical protein EZS26_003542 [Candidatus Ordinivivax streblomastigis]
MKNIFNTILFLAVISFFSACEENAIDDLAGTYPSPTPYTLGKVLLQNVQKNEKSRTITLQLATDGLTTPNAGTGNYLAIDFVGDRLNSFLVPGVYTAAANPSAPSIGNYIMGDNTCWYTIDNGAVSSKFKVTDGTFFVTRTNDSHYTISGTLLLEDKFMVKVSYEGEIIFEIDPPAYTYAIEVSKPYTWTVDGTNFTPVPGSQLNKITVSSEDIPVAYFEIVTEENPALLSGTYPVKAVNSLEGAGAFVQGQYMNLLWLGIVDMAIESGSYYWDGETKMFIRDGNINIADNGGTLSFTGNGLGIQDISTEMEFGNLPAPGSVNYQNATPASDGGGDEITLATVFSASALDNSLFGGSGYTVTLKIATGGVTATSNDMSGFTFSGNGNYISLDFKSDAATLTPGTYNVAANESAAVGDVIAGYPALFGGTGYWGSVWGTVTGDAVTDDQVTGGAVVLAKSGDVYAITANITTETGNITAVYTGEITIQ